MAKPARNAAAQSKRAKTGPPVRADRRNATNVSEPFDPTGSRAHDDHTKRLGNHNSLARRDPSGARGNEDRRAGPERDRTKR